MVHVVLQVGVGRWSGITWRLQGSQGRESSSSDFFFAFRVPTRGNRLVRGSSTSERENFLPGVNFKGRFFRDPVSALFCEPPTP